MTTDTDLLAHAEAYADDILEHHGVKGMKWGERRAAKAADKADMQWQHKIYSVHGAVTLHNHVAAKLNNGEIDKFNARPENRNRKNWGTNVKDDNRYIHDYNQLYAHHTANSVKELYGKSPSGKLEAKYHETPNGPAVVVHEVRPVAHDVMAAGAMAAPIHLEFPQKKHDKHFSETATARTDTEQNHVQMLTHAEAYADDILLTQAEAYADDVLEHHGIKGMKWGVRRDHSSSSGGATVVSRTKKKINGDTNIKKPPKHAPKNNKFQPRVVKPALSEHALKKLPDHELKSAVDRLKLETKYKDLSKPEKSEGKKFLDRYLGSLGDHIISKAVTGTVTAVNPVAGAAVGAAASGRRARRSKMTTPRALNP